jgi:hypothetical protein
MMRTLSPNALALAVALAASVAPALASAAAPAPYTATYEVRRNGDRLGTATVSFRQLPNGRFELLSDTVGSEGLAAIAGVTVNERSILRWNAQPETVAYSYRQKMAWKSRERGLQVDAGAGTIASRDKDRSYSLRYEPGVLDRNAVVVALMADLAEGKTGDLRYRIPDKDALETYVYRTGGSEQVQTAMGAQRALRVERIRESSNGRSTTLWLGEQRNYVPLRMLQREPDGETIEMKILSLR